MSTTEKKPSEKAPSAKAPSAKAPSAQAPTPDLIERKSDRGGSDIDSDKENSVKQYIPKNPIINPVDVKISKVMQELMKNDSK